MIASASTLSSITLARLNPSVGNIISNSTALLKSIAILVTNENIPDLKIRYTKLQNRNLAITLLCEKTLKQSMIDKNIDEKETLELKKLENSYLDGRKELLKNTQFIFEVFLLFF